MNFYELLNNLQNLIKDRKVRQIDIARALETSKSNISQKFINDSEVSVSELLKVQDYFGVKIFIKKEELENYNENLANFKTFGERLNYLMGEHNLTADKLAREIDTPASLIERLGLDKTEPDLKILKKLKDYFNVSIDLLIDGNSCCKADSSLSPEELKILEVLQKAKRNNLI